MAATMRKRYYKQNRLQQLRGFCYTAREGSVSRAAQRMFLSQPSVSLQIRALERELGVVLFERRGPRITLTPDGEALVRLAEPLVTGLDSLDEAFAAQRGVVAGGSVEIAAGESTILYWLPGYVRKFAEHYPGVQIRLHNVTGRDGLRMLRDGRVDFAVGPMVERQEDIVFREIVAFEPVLITPPHHPLARKKRVTLRDVSRHPLILPPRQLTTWRLVDAAFRQRSLGYHIKLEAGGWEVIKKYVELGLGVSIVTGICLTGREKLARIPLGSYFPKRRYGVVLRRGRFLSPQAQRFVEIMDPTFPTAESGLGKLPANR